MKAPGHGPLFGMDKKKEHLRQRIGNPSAHQTRDIGKLAAVPVGRLMVGTFDLKKWTDAGLKSLNDLPRLSAPKASDPVYAWVLGPLLKEGENMALREILWKDKTVILRVDLWRDNTARKKSIPAFPLLVVPLETPRENGKTLPGEYTVKVEWTLLRAPEFDGLYAVEDTSKGPAGELFKHLNEESQAKFKIDKE